MIFVTGGSLKEADKAALGKLFAKNRATTITNEGHVLEEVEVTFDKDCWIVVDSGVALDVYPK